MNVDKEKCTGCGICYPYCPVGAIGPFESENDPASEINQDQCVECGVCLRSGVCPTDALYMPELRWPRSIRAEFSNPITKHPSGSKGRGTQEMKTNDVTGRFRRGMAGIGVELGRPGVGTTFKDLQTVSMALARAGVEFEPNNPVSALMEDRKTGKMNEEVLNETVLSAIIECKVEIGRLKEVLETLKAVAKRIETVFSLDLISRVNEDGSIPAVAIANEAGLPPRPNTKMNLGLGRPLKEEVSG
ncbi:MAG: indolepyruvate ferredoxin oxidoreductase subunit alpha [Thermodesulfobacteriota bacterium]